MNLSQTPLLAACLRRYDVSAADASPLALYEACFPMLERELWEAGADFEALLGDYQALHREMEAVIAASGADGRHEFLIGIPVADRPEHLRACLESIETVCRRFGYGGRDEDGVWKKIRVIVGEDSQNPEHVRAHQELAAEFSARGLSVRHLGFDEQYALLAALPEAVRKPLARLLTNQPRERFWHKGQAANRNLLYLAFRRFTRDRTRTLYYFLDSDQSLAVNRHDAHTPVYAIPYFHAFDRIFRNTDTLLLTGKMVGDPPVSPAVMAVNFLTDVIAFFERLARQAPHAACTFHGRNGPLAAEAAYHDMAGLFGYGNPAQSFAYVCRLAGEHDHLACLDDFSGRLAGFFFGEHLTRATGFTHGDGYDRLSPARTVYPGNYVARWAGLRYPIPFGHLRLRMSGPTAGRLIAAEIGSRFASCNLPNLHRRTAGEAAANFRPGVAREDARVDLSDEFERQFFGDLMLFTAEALVKEADVRHPFPRECVEAVLARKEAELLALYEEKHTRLEQLRQALENLVFGSGHWWLQKPEVTEAVARVRAFLDQIAHNFGEYATAWRNIRSPEHRAQRRAQIANALQGYRTERELWATLFPDG